MPDEARVRSLPAGWTDVEGPDPFLVLAAGRTHFRVADLLALTTLLAELDRRRQGDSAGGVRAILPGQDPHAPE